MHCVPKIVLLACALIVCVGCSNRQLKNRVIKAERHTNTVRSDVLALEQRVQSLEGHMQNLSSEVNSLEVTTRRGKKTNYVVTPAVKTGSAAAPAVLTAAPAYTTPAGQAAPRTKTRTAAPTPTPVPSPALSTSAALSLPPATAPVPSASTTSGATGTFVPASTTPPTTPLPVQGAMSLALPPENGTAGQKMQSTSAPAGGAFLPPAASPNSAPATVTTTPQRPVTLAPLAPKMKGEEAAYNAALALARGGRPQEAIQHFTTFLQQYPSGRYAPNAYYWIGECLYAQRQYPEALLQFKEVSSRYPRHHKSADALLKAGMTYTRMGDRENAALQYRAVLTDFPASEAARYVKGRGLAR